MVEILGEPLEAGSIVARSYRLERIVGEGGMGVVWAAREIATGRAVALKFLREGREADLRNQERVLREARAAMAISHSNIAKVEAVLETDAGVPFLVMELLEGESLRALLRRRGALSPVECARILLPVVDAVLAAHASHIVHRDLKPENVFLSDLRELVSCESHDLSDLRELVSCESHDLSDLRELGQRVRVLDFGIAKHLPRAGEAEAASLTSTGALIGTPIYMAPEQVFGDDDVDGSADVWSLGIMLYECLAAKRPTDGDGFGPIIKRITTETLEPLEQARAGLPRRITSLVGRMLIRNRAERPALAEVRAVLASIVDAGEGAAPSLRAPDLPADPVAPLVGSTTGGVAGQRIASDAPPPQKAGRQRLVIALAALGVMGALGRTFFFAREKQAAVSPALIDRASVAEATVLVQEAAAAQGRRDGATCLQRLDKLDRDFAARMGSGASSDPMSGNAPNRAMCMMLVGRCTDGMALYRKWMIPYIAEGGVIDIDQTMESLGAEYCEGEALPPRVALLRANRLLHGMTGYKRTPTAAECQEWSATQQRLLPQVQGDLNQLGIFSTETNLARCLERAAAARDH